MIYISCFVKSFTKLQYTVINPDNVIAVEEHSAIMRGDETITPYHIEIRMVGCVSYKAKLSLTEFIVAFKEMTGRDVKDLGKDHN